MDRGKIWKKLSWPDSRLSLSDEDFLNAAVEKNKSILTELTNGRSWAEFDDGFLEGPNGFNSRAVLIFISEVLFYFLAQVGRRRPGLFPVPDINLAAFNILANRHDCIGKRLICLDLALLPVAVLAAGFGAQIVPPPRLLDSWSSLLLSKALSDNRSMEGALVIGGDPLMLMERHSDLLEELAKIQGGLIFSHWDFLGVNLYSFQRSRWLEQGLLRTIIQLPLPRRQSARYYPALLEIGPGRPDPESGQTVIRLADVREQSSVLGNLSQSEVLDAVFQPPEEGKTLDITPNRLAMAEKGDFTPRRFLAGQQKNGEVPLGDCARLLRCHLPRERHDPEKDGSGLVCREISLSHLDDITGFVMPGAGHLARVQGLDPRGPEGKFLLRRHDILMCYRGTEATIGRVGLVVTAPDEPTICGQSIFVIRVVDGDPVWLYYHFRLEQVRQRILSRCSGRSMLTVNIGEMRNLLVAKPDQSQSATINSRHEGLLTTMCEVKTLLDKAGEEIGTIEREVY